MPDIQEGITEGERAAVPETRRRRKDASSEFWERVVYLLVGVASIAAVFIKLQFSTDGVCCGDFDGYYHIKWSSLLWEGMRRSVFPPAFVWLPLTTLDPKGYVDHHLLFHILQIPFTWFMELRMAAKVSATIFASLAVFSCYWLIVRYRVRYTLCWLIALLACSAPFLYRMNMAKAPPLAIVFMIIGIYLLFEKKYVWLAPLAFLFVWTYSLFVTLLAAACVWPIVVFWSERAFDRRSVWRTLSAPVYTIAGTIAGFIINPYFPKNVWLFYEHVRIKVTAGDFTTSVGTEWYPYESWYFLGSCIIAFAAMMIGYVAYDWSDRRRAARPLLLMVFSTLLMIASFRSRRFVEYWPPFAVLFAAFSLQPLLEGARSIFSRMPRDMIDELEPFLDRDVSPAEVEREKRTRFWDEPVLAVTGFALGIVLFFTYYQFTTLRGSGQAAAAGAAPQPLNKMAVAWIVVAFLVYAATTIFYTWRLRSAARTFGIIVLSFVTVTLFINVQETARSIADDHGRDFYAKGMAWVRDNVPEGERVFNTDWDDFPKMFFYDTKHTYVSGLDPTYLLDKNPELSKLYEQITLGKEKDPGPLIRDRFGARYVFTDNEDIHNDFYYNALQSGWFERVYEDEDCTVLKIRDQKGEPPPEANEDEGDVPDDGADETEN
ncbi:MAG TPA: hypothetical protein VJS44_14255 [Pyrinomonadaceae bacterium]|nr:hypothetical protein [Pyrinomonadaceae bacterium]